MKGVDHRPEITVSTSRLTCVLPFMSPTKLPRHCRQPRVSLPFRPQRSGASKASRSTRKVRSIIRIEFSAAGDYVERSELVDLMELRRPQADRRDWRAWIATGIRFNIIEEVQMRDAETLLVTDDNNFL
jgi:hypothetical protein